MITLNQDEILKSIDKHMESLKATVKSALFAAIIFWWAGLMQEDPLNIFGMTVPLEFALYFAIAFYLFINLSILEKLTRIYNLMILVSDANFLKTVSNIFLYPSFANPFAYFGRTFMSRLNSSKGFGVLIIIWWVCNSSIYSLSKNSMTFFGLALQGSFLFIGLWSMLVIDRNFKYILTRLKTVDDELFQAVSRTKEMRTVVTVICIGIAGVFAYLTMLFSNAPTATKDTISL